jgi:FdhE protein
MAASAPVVSAPWAARRRRAEHLRERYQFAGEVLSLYLTLLDVHEPAFEAAARAVLDWDEVARLARELLPRVIEVTVTAGPSQLAAATMGRYHSADLDDLVGRWLRGAEQSTVDRYLARAATAPFCEAMSKQGPPFPDSARESGGPLSCPTCGGPPQVSCFGESNESLVTGPRRLVCARCASDWIFPRLTCAGCGETDPKKLPVYSEADTFPHLRIDACETCHRYLISVDERREPAAVPAVDELAALPLDLYAKQRGLTKVTPNLMGI